MMEPFELQLSYIKYAGISRSSSRRQKMIDSALIFINFASLAILSLSCMIFISKSRDILEICESLAMPLTGIYTFGKYICWVLYREKLFDVIDDIKLLNDRCE